MWNDPELAIEWPLIDGAEVLVSEKDAAGTPFRHAEVYE